MDGTGRIDVTVIYDGTSISASGSAYSDIVPLQDVRGNISLHVEMSGSGTATIIPLVSNDALETADGSTTWIQPYDSTSTAISICTAFANDGGPGSDGNAVFPVSIPAAGRLKFKITEAGGANPITPILKIAHQ